MISKFELQAFRCFKEKQTLVFAIPNEGKIGSGITYLVGINNCGKTSLLEGLKLNATQSITSSVLRNSDIRSDDIYFVIYDEKNRVVQKLVPFRQGSARLKNVSSHTGEPPMAIFIPSRRQWSPVVNNDLGIDNFKNSYSMSNVSLRQRFDGYIDSQMADIFCSIESDEDSYKHFVSLMREVFPDFTSFTVEKEESAVIAYKMNDGARHRADFLGDGIISVMRIVAYLIINKNQLIVIDEPELSLHPSALRKLSCLLAKSAEHQQILLATHSPYLIDWEYISNGAKLNHIVYSDGESAIHTLGEVSKYKGLITGANWQQPFLMDVVAKEIFFNDNILFTEGQEDVGLLRSETGLSDKIRLFGYGARGYHSFRFALELAKDLGVKKAGVLIDGGKKEMDEVGKLKKDYPKYLITQWDREDIRDKPGCCPLMPDGSPDLDHTRPAKNGYFYENGKIKPENELGDYREKIAQINNYFDGKTPSQDDEQHTLSGYFGLSDA